MMKCQNAKSRTWIVCVAGALVLACSGGLTDRASAQPQQRQTMPNWQNMTPQQIERMLRNLPPEQQQQMQQLLQIMTPQQRQQILQALPPAQREKFEQMFEQAQEWAQDRLQQQRREWIRQTLVASGYTDATVQDAVIAFMQAQEEARQPLRKTAQDLTALLIETATADDDFKKQLADFRNDMKKEEERYTQELTALDEKIKYSTHPRLETLLTVLGIVGQETPALGGVGSLFPDSPFGNFRGTA